MTWSRLVTVAQAEVDRLVEQLPVPLRAHARALPVSCEPRPSRALQRDGMEPDLLGLFVGLPYKDAESGQHDLPAQILLFLENILDEAGGDLEGYRREVRKTYLHELGHYLGLDEGDLLARGMD